MGSTSTSRARQLGSRLTTLWVVTMLLAGLFVAPPIAIAADPLPVRNPGSGVTTPTTPSEAQVAAQSSTAFGIGDVFVAIGNGLVQWRRPDGTLNATLDTGLGGFTTGMAFDKTPGDLYVTNFTAGAVTRRRSGPVGRASNGAELARLLRHPVHPAHPFPALRPDPWTTNPFGGIWVESLAGRLPNQVDGFFRYRYLGDPPNTESGATLARDLIVEADDAPRLSRSGGSGREMPG